MTGGSTVIGESLSRLIDAEHGEALHAAVQILTDRFLEDLALLEESEDFSQTSMEGFLPRKNLRRYGPGFARRFFVCMVIVGGKLFSKKREELCCVAEELALNAIIEQAESVLEMDGTEADYSVLVDSAFQDLDFELMFQDELDGFEDTEAAKQMGVGFLRFEDWFAQFKNTGPVHPYCQE